MKSLRTFAGKLVTFGAVVLALSMVASLEAQTTKEGKAVVRAIRGSAKYSTGSGVWMPLAVGVELRAGTLIETSPGSSVDLNLDVNGPMVRVTEATVLGLDKMTFTDTGADTVIDTQLNLKAGRILGTVRKMAAASRYEVKTPNGVAGIRGTHYDISATGVITVEEGQVIFAYVNPADGSVKAFIINAGETFVPPGNVVPADPLVIDELRRIFPELLGYDVVVEPSRNPIIIFVAPENNPTSDVNPGQPVYTPPVE